MKIINETIACIKSVIARETAKQEGLLQKGLLGVSAAIVFLAVSAIGFPSTASADNTDVVTFTLEINKTTGKVVGVLDKSGHTPVRHDPQRGPGQPHGAHVGEPIPVTIILGLEGASGGAHTTCPSGTTHVIIANVHYCF